ncbi:efflux RND transporter periplasmic adaptor subunit [Vulgatibacter incomptus]|uniref:Putative Co/Zn/Cd efflux system membrane fusion protein n=1 Tax=Vulgatibacter incomptus TaxID=1391653 RepID=A0A0K1PI04_9BACT|nr:hypothetical protein [Vulgatibacter incomptus]AKU93147.1 putative Co/Zn/Cd efflux system membrane fusion protein [Vulgatibacter incomptus]
MSAHGLHDGRRASCGAGRGDLVAAILLVAALGGASCKGDPDPGRDGEAARSQRLQPDGSVRLSASDRASLGLRVEAAALVDLPDVRLRLGRVLARPVDGISIVSPTLARVSEVSPLSIGDDLQAGAILAILEPLLSPSERIGVDVQAADLAGQLQAARRELSLHEAAAARANALSEATIVSGQARQEADTLVETTRARIAGLERARAASRGHGAVPLFTPESGRLAAFDVNLGAVVHPGDVIAHVIAKGPRWIDVLAAPDEPSGDSYEIRAGSEWIPARLVGTGGVVGNDGARRDRLEVDESNALRLLPGASVPVRVAVGASSGVVVPEAALVPVVGGDLVFVEGADGAFRPRLVTAVARLAGRVRIGTGLKVGERIVVSGAMGLRGETLRSLLEVD